MRELLIIGGPHHGQTVQADPFAIDDRVKVPMPEGVQALDTETRLPLIGFKEITYVVRKFAVQTNAGKQAWRSVLVEEHLSPEQAGQMLREFLVEQFVLTGPDYVNFTQ